MSNLKQPEFVKSVRQALKLTKEQSEGVVNLIIRLAVQSLVKDLDNEIGTRLDYSLEVVLEGDQSVVYLPSNCSTLRHLTINQIEVIPVSKSEFIEISHITQEQEAPSFLYGTVDIDNDGRRKVILSRQLQDTDYDVEANYRIHTDVLTHIPEQYELSLVYACVMHYRNLYHIGDVAAQSKAESNYEKLIAADRHLEQSNQNNQKRPYEGKWRSGITEADHYNNAIYAR